MVIMAKDDERDWELQDQRLLNERIIIDIKIASKHWI